MYRSGRGRLIHYEDGWLDTARRRHISHQEKQNYWLNHHMSNIYFEIKHWKSIERPHRCCVWRGGKLGNLHKLLSTGTSSWPWTGPKESVTEGPLGNHTPAVGLWGPGYKIPWPPWTFKLAGKTCLGLKQRQSLNLHGVQWVLQCMVQQQLNTTIGTYSPGLSILLWGIIAPDDCWVGREQDCLSLGTRIYVPPCPFQYHLLCHSHRRVPTAKPPFLYLSVLLVACE